MDDKTNIADRVRQIVAEVLDEPVSAMDANPVLAAHEWDSRVSLEALAQLEAAFVVAVDLRSFHAARTVNDLVDLVIRSQPTPTR